MAREGGVLCLQRHTVFYHNCVDLTQLFVNDVKPDRSCEGHHQNKIFELFNSSPITGLAMNDLSLNCSLKCSSPFAYPQIL